MTAMIDLSHTIERGMITYKGLPAPIICDFLSREASKSHYGDGTSFHIGWIEMVGNTGTYIDAPFHRYAEGNDLSQLPLRSLAGLDGIVVHVPPDHKPIGGDFFSGLDVKGKAVLVHTGWDTHWGTDQYFENHPYLTEDAAEYLKTSGAVLVGIDSLNIDDTSDGNRPVHTILLGADIPIVEHMCHLEKLPDAPFTFNAVPVKIKGCGSFPVRAYAVIHR